MNEQTLDDTTTQLWLLAAGELGPAEALELQRKIASDSALLAQLDAVRHDLQVLEPLRDGSLRASAYAVTAARTAVSAYVARSAVAPKAAVPPRNTRWMKYAGMAAAAVLTMSVLAYYEMSRDPGTTLASSDGASGHNGRWRSDDERLPGLYQIDLDDAARGSNSGKIEDEQAALEALAWASDSGR